MRTNFSTGKWVLVALVSSAGCRFGYDQVRELGAGAAAGSGSGRGGTSIGGASGASRGGSSQGGSSGGTVGQGGDAGEPGTGGVDPTGGTAGTSSPGGEGGEAAASTGGTSGATNGGSGGAGRGGAGGSAASAGAGGNGGSAASAGIGGAGGSAASAGAGGAGGSAASAGTGGNGGSAGAPNPALCNNATFGGHDYLLCKEERNWAAAASGCVTAGMRLVRVDDAAENQWLFDNAFTEAGRNSLVWIGATDQAVEGEWRWTDGALFWLGNNTGMAQGGLFTAWYFREPNNVSTAEHCASLESNGSNPEWYDTRCELLTPFICESL